jgi:hypothetical protein
MHLERLEARAIVRHRDMVSKLASLKPFLSAGQASNSELFSGRTKAGHVGMRPGQSAGSGGGFGQEPGAFATFPVTA